MHRHALPVITQGFRVQQRSYRVTSINFSRLGTTSVEMGVLLGPYVFEVCEQKEAVRSDQYLMRHLVQAR